MLLSTKRVGTTPESQQQRKENLKKRTGGEGRKKGWHTIVMAARPEATAKPSRTPQAQQQQPTKTAGERKGRKVPPPPAYPELSSRRTDLHMNKAGAQEKYRKAPPRAAYPDRGNPRRAGLQLNKSYREMYRKVPPRAANPGRSSRRGNSPVPLPFLRRI